MRKSILVVFCLFFILGCGRIKSDRKQLDSLDNSQVNVMDIDVDAEQSYISLSEVFDSVEFVLLDPGSERLLGEITTMELFEGQLIIFDIQNTCIFIFDLNGQLKNSICNIGRGPGQYNYIQDIFVDKDTRELILLTDRNFQFYDLQNFSLKREEPKTNFSVQTCYIGQSIFANYLANMSSPNSSHNLFFTKKNKVISRYFPIDPELSDFNFSPKNNFSLKNDSDFKTFSLPFENIIYELNGSNVSKKIILNYSENKLPEDFLNKSNIDDLALNIVKSGYCYGNENFFEDEGFRFFRFRNEKKLNYCFSNLGSKMSLSNVIVDDLTSLPFRDFVYGSTKFHFLAGYGYVHDIRGTLEMLKENITGDQLKKAFQKIPRELLDISEGNNLDEGSIFLIKYYY